ncbi:alpha-glucosidase [Parabacteroides sp. PFB2-12]|uniref:glycoside hydrolase family 97 protein n=1 Tax=unclassified Parabacteroides TaxID=2649774 RepID=UPI002476B4B4|nr:MULTISPECIES: glycoside hydrolase family 97 protein [unclassified Parabacteroides]MDH6343072.1 alpha-glucosidase [Parabacteroides sp. PM6-13]MDH6390415.1 alpha-glucosidase [Parabacteroides sp. PFB2-12]
MKFLKAFVFVVCSISWLSAAEVTIQSPDNRYKVVIQEKGNRLGFTLDFEGRTVVYPSLLGIQANADWKEGVKIGEVSRHTVDQNWTPVYGERAIVKEHYNSCLINLSLDGNRRGRLQLEVRAYDEGVAFRYVFPGGEYLHITDEYTEFTLPEGSMAWYTARAQTAYERLPLKNWPGESERPLVVELPEGPYLLLTEAEVVNYARTKFALSEKPNTIRSVMYGAVDEIAPFSTPWRVMMVANKPGELIENNDLLLNLNPPSRIENPWWITPGKVMREVTLTTEGAKAVVDFAVKRNLQYVHFDAGWYGPENDWRSDATTVTLDPGRNPNPDALDLQEAIAYAKKHNKKVILYVNQRALARQLDEILPLYKSWGVDGLKFGFVQVGSQVWTKWMHDAVVKCAEYGLVVDIHDEYRPTGFSRTYPNLMTQEGIRGNEEFPDATHNALLPFTRFTQGAGDYTICYYRRDFNGTGKSDTSHGLVNARLLSTTPSHQLALAVIYYSPLQYVYWYDKPSESQDEPELEFFDNVPTVWDDTKVIDGRPAEFISMARRSGDDWFVGSITNTEARRISIPFDFLDPAATYTAHIYEDNPKVKTRTKVGIRHLRVTAQTVLDVTLLSSGGQAIWITKNK